MFVDLDKFLKARYTPDIPEGLSARIIAAAHRTDQSAVRRYSIRDALMGLVAEWKPVLVIPQPAYVVAGLVVFTIGVSLGMGVDSTSLLGGLSVGDLAGFMEINDSFVVSEWV